MEKEVETELETKLDKNDIIDICIFIVSLFFIILFGYMYLKWKWGLI